VSAPPLSSSACDTCRLPRTHVAGFLSSPRRDLAKQYEKKLEQLKREEELIREEQRELAEALPHDDPDAAKGLVRAPTVDSISLPILKPESTHGLYRYLTLNLMSTPQRPRRRQGPGACPQ